MFAIPRLLIPPVKAGGNFKDGKLGNAQQQALRGGRSDIFINNNKTSDTPRLLIPPCGNTGGTFINRASLVRQGRY